MRKLSAEEEELWARVTATIRPLSREPQPVQAALPTSPSTVKVEAAPSRVKARVPPARSSPPPTAARATVHGSLDGHWERRLRSGTVEPDRTLDLHGHSLDSAWTAIDRALDQAITRGDRVLLLITGHHRPGEPPVARGRIRAAVHDWLAVSRHASRIAAVRSAHRRHGGGGSLYLILKR
ncbi:Smr/MutS family protein [Sphingomonas arenae]|uniref:Smr/MutS family protein n=1 Tax=Sphingomonas arenae TaxID=2812555 RepID=UPI0019676F59